MGASVAAVVPLGVSPPAGAVAAAAPVPSATAGGSPDEHPLTTARPKTAEYQKRRTVLMMDGKEMQSVAAWRG
ncbi:MAG: hypothetical protein IAF94_15115 [Pirellulaceae bacterium]|nr:hypothetical protein [Pirellulaceae bacterium]